MKEKKKKCVFVCFVRSEKERKREKNICENDSLNTQNLENEKNSFKYMNRERKAKPIM